MANELQAGRKPKNFYEQALTEAERVRLPGARDVEGVDEEIALLRVKLATRLEEHPEDIEVALKCVTLLIRAVAVKYRLSPQSAENLSQKIMAVIRELGGGLIPEGIHEAG